MMSDEVSMCPFQRTVEGSRGTVLLRRNHDHAERCVKIIRRRPVPSWSTRHAEIVELLP